MEETENELVNHFMDNDGEYVLVNELSAVLDAIERIGVDVSMLMRSEESSFYATYQESISR